ncbi:hypothetical protein JCM1840_001495 [Sporobolomyces johnsonii]
MSVAVIQGAGGALGSNFARHLLRQTNLSIVATSRDPSATKRAILESGDGKLDGSRLKVIEVDGKVEDTIKRAAKEVEQEFGEKSLRLLINASGVLHADKSVAEVDYDKLLESFQLNTIAHLLAFKHFYPLLPQKNDIRSTKADSDEQDPANGMLHPGLGVLASLTVRIGSIGDNRKGGWIAYRASKAAANQVVATLERELSMRSTPSIAVALHPGTVVGTNLSRPWTKESDAGKKEGVFTAEVSTAKLLDVISGLKASDGGKFLDYAGKEIVW